MFKFITTLSASDLLELKKLQSNVVGTPGYVKVTCVLMFALIERLWKFLRKKVINTGFYRTKEKFRKAVKSFFEDIVIYKTELESLLTLNFRLANSQSISF